MSSECSIVLLESALAGNLSADDEAVLNRHLDECEQCSAALEQMAGGAAWCQEAAALLVNDALDEALPAREEWSDADFTVEHLEPAEEPGMLGRLGGYDVLEIIGRGGMGVVLKGYDPELKRCVAIKVLAPQFALSSLARKRFTREAQAAASVVHPNVLAIHQVHPNGRLPFLVMPLVAGESLAQRLTTQGRLELKETLRIGMQAAAGLAAAHEQGLVHRDVKPANILLEKGVERAVLTDFGLALAADDVTLTRWGVIAGTPQYMSPEQARGEPLDARSELFSLGCVLYEMATGVSPFKTESVMATIRRLVDQSPRAILSLNPELPPWFVAIVDRLLEKDPARRFSSAKEVSELLEGCLAHVQQPGSVPLPAALPKPVKRRTKWSNVFHFKGVVAMIIALGIGLMGTFLYLSEPPPDISGLWQSEDWGTVDLKKSGEREYTGTYTETDSKDSKRKGEIRLKWARIERRFNGTWREANRFGDLSVHKVGDEIRGALTTDPKSDPNTPRLAELSWTRDNAPSVDEHGLRSENTMTKKFRPQLFVIPSVDEHGLRSENTVPRDVAAAVGVAVNLVSTCAEGDPRVALSMESLKGLNEADVVKELARLLDSPTANIRRAAIYVLWKGKPASIEAVVPKLTQLCKHEEDFTRGMAALALGGNHVGSSLEVLEKMTSEDRSGYARRCGAIALGYLGNPAAIPVLKKALDDPEQLVRKNAQAALKMLAVKAAEKARPNPPKTAEVSDLNPGDSTVRAAIKFLSKSSEKAETNAAEKHESATRAIPLRFKLASDMANDLRQILLGRPGQEAKPSANNREIAVTAPPEVMTRAQTFITVMDWPDNITRQPNYEYPQDSVLHAARSFFYACAIEDAEEVFSKLLSLHVLAELKGETKSKNYLDYSMGQAPDAEWEKSLRGDWPGKKEAIERLVHEWNRYPLSRISEDSGIAIGFGVKHFCSVSFDGAPKDFYGVTIEPSRRGPPANVSYFFSSLPPWWNPGEKKIAAPASDPRSSSPPRR